MSLSIIVPTVGRPTLDATLRSIADQLTADDLVIVAADLPDGTKRKQVSRLVHDYADRGTACRWTFAFPPAPVGCWGHALRNIALNLRVDTTHVCTIDDDDVYLPGALDAIRERGCRDRPVVFKARWGAGHPAAGVQLWHFPEVRPGNVATPMVVWPAGVKARFGFRYEGDLDFYRALESEYGRLHWEEQVICEVRPIAVAG